MTRFWLNLKTLEHRINTADYAPARRDAIKWLGEEDLAWFSSMEELQTYVAAQLLPVLERAWKANPHWRFGQLIANAVKKDTYYVRDGDFIELLKAVTKWDI